MSKLEDFIKDVETYEKAEDIAVRINEYEPTSPKGKVAYREAATIIYNHNDVVKKNFGSVDALVKSPKAVETTFGAYLDKFASQKIVDQSLEDRLNEVLPEIEDSKLARIGVVTSDIVLENSDDEFRSKVEQYKQVGQLKHQAELVRGRNIKEIEDENLRAGIVKAAVSRWIEDYKEAEKKKGTSEDDVERNVYLLASLGQSVLDENLETDGELKREYMDKGVERYIEVIDKQYKEQMEKIGGEKVIAEGVRKAIVKLAQEGGKKKDILAGRFIRSIVKEKS